MPRKKKNKVEVFFDTIEEYWNSVPGYVKVFLYSASSSAFGLWVAGELDMRAVAIIVASNLGIYTLPRATGTSIKKMIK